MSHFSYGFAKTLENATFNDALGQVTEALRSEGFGVLTEIDVKQTLKDKLNEDFRQYTILGACSPALARQALAEEAQIGLLLPCNIVVQEAPTTGVIVSIADPRVMFNLVDNPAVAPVAQDVNRRLRRLVASLK